MPPKPALRPIVKKPRAKKQDMIAFVGQFAKLVRLEANELNRTIAQAIRDEVIDIIEQQRYNWKPLSVEYLKRKLEEDLDPRIYIRTGFLIEHIVVWEDQDGVHVGVKPKVVHPETGTPLWIIVRVLEFGNERVPARPIWRPVLSKYIRLFPDFAKQYRKGVAQKATGMIGKAHIQWRKTHPAGRGGA